MRTAILFGLLAASATSYALKYTVPASLKATAVDCVYPANYTVTNFTVFTNAADSAKNVTSFYFADAGTGINTTCSHNLTSKPSSVGTNRWPCDNSNVSFIYQTTGVAGLTMVEVACPGSTPQFEASGLITPNLTCTNSSSASTCVAKQSILGEFDSFEPAPPS
ncbi:uncharacterized protein F4807DRAFT_429907 [Annulohypoxylon truncatum]|uniref:uncharacterized protein n=1 Tax=Annulohypoxylon truncatum TaxID=327061 RepID=UPI002008104D|nr:uncharacterized protein F4807DRAFT_429907 [Annulohypoxylon truncatum]KAI1208905.1 hypothetical protein F4807DRAFT_429907 [Annulohypoxylon truncatum]